ncbi:MAG: LamG domain-containing protein, partial [Planctomycetota bacterium]
MWNRLICSSTFAAVLVLALTLGGSASAELVAHWKFDEGQGTTAFDSSGNGYDMTLFDDPVWVDGYDGGAINTLDGGYGAIQGLYYDTTPIPDTTGLTVCAWIRTSAAGGQYIVSFDRNEYYRFSVNTTAAADSGQVDWDVYDDSGQIDYGSETRVDDGEWHHVAGVYDNGTMTIYIDGNAEPSVTGGSTWGRWRDTRYGFLGKNSESTGFNEPVPSGNPVDGDIDDLRIYHNALSQVEIRLLSGHPESYEPDPADGVMLTQTWTNLLWAPGPHAVSHDVYFSDNFDDVNDGAEAAFRGNQAAATMIVGFPGFPFPEGLAPGTTYYWRIDDVAADGAIIRGQIWSFWIPPTNAYDPAPGDSEPAEPTDAVLSWSPGMNTIMTGVYFGTDPNEVANAAGAPPNMDTTYDPGPLALDTEYYWRVDTFNGTEWFTGSVWSFKTRPDIPPAADPNLVAWWKLDEGAGTTVLDWSGHDNHGELFQLEGLEWTAAGWSDAGDKALSFDDEGYVAIDNINYSGGGRTEVTVCAWVRTSDPNDQYILSFDRNEYYRLQINGEVAGDGQVGWHVMTINAGAEQQLDYGSVTRVDDGLWHHITGVFKNGTSTIFIDGIPEPPAVGGPTYGIGDLVRFGFIGANSEATDYNGSRGDGTGVTGDLGDLRIYDKALTQEEILQVMRGDPAAAWDLRPTNGRIPEIDDVTRLSWRAGDGASQHDVYFGTDADAVASADASDATGVYRGRQSGTVYTPSEGFDWGQSYHWRVDEVDSGGSLTAGQVRTVNVADYITVESFEDYNDYPPNEIWNTWVDGFGTANNGAVSGYADPDFTALEHYVETGTVSTGRQSLPLFYDTNFKFSEAARTFASPSDWTGHGVEELTLSYFGDPCNVVAERMYVAVTGGGTAVVYNEDPNLLADEWIQWVIPLQTLADEGVNLRSVTGIALGFGTRGDAATAGSSGVVFFDDIRLRRTPPVPVIAVAPLTSLEAERDPADAATLTAVLNINGIDASALVVGTTTTDFEKHADREAVHADNLDLTAYASLDDSTVIQTVFAQPVTTIFIMERGANDSGFFQALDADGNRTGEMVAFTAADFQLPEAGLKIVGQDAGGIAIQSDVPIGGFMILPPEGGLHSID